MYRIFCVGVCGGMGGGVGVCVCGMCLPFRSGLKKNNIRKKYITTRNLLNCNDRFTSYFFIRFSLSLLSLSLSLSLSFSLPLSLLSLSLTLCLCVKIDYFYIVHADTSLHNTPPNRKDIHGDLGGCLMSKIWNLEIKWT